MATFLGRALFQGDAKAGYIFAATKVDFRSVFIDLPDGVAFLEADLTKCLFLNTDLRKVHLIGVKWPQKCRRVLVYDEIASVEAAGGTMRPWSQLERLYRVKQNYEDRRDYERARDFHYNEKEMRR